MTETEYKNIQTGDVIENQGLTGTATGKYVNGMPEVVWSDKLGEKGTILSEIFMDSARIVRKGRML